MAKAEIDEHGPRARRIEQVLNELPKILQNRTLGRALRAGGNVVKKETKRRTPRGDPKHKPDKKPLHKTIIVVVKEYDGGRLQMAIVGFKYPEGAHGHLVEHGHQIVTRNGAKTGARVEGKQFFAPAVDTTQGQQEKAMVDVIVKDIKENGG